MLITGGILLLNGYCRRNAFNGIDIGLLDALQELARVGREGLNIAALAFGIDSVEGEGRLARPGDPSHDGESVVGYLEIYVLKIMNARTAHDDAVIGHDWAVTGHTESPVVVSESFYYN